MLEAEALVKSRAGFRLELDMRLGKAEVAAVLGPSGCGKTTLLRLIAGLARPDSGRILLDGRDITGLAPERRGIGMVFQDFALFPHMSVRRNIEYGPRMRGLGRRERGRIAERLAASFEISPLLERSPYSLSGGEQQRAALARALAAEPSIILLDEPLSSLDASLRRKLRVEISDRLREAGVAAILVTHDAEEAFAAADRIFLMRGGRIEAEGRAEELYAAPPTAWSAAFLGRGPVLEILTLEAKGSSLLARTAAGDFLCAGGAERAIGETAVSLFFPSEAPRVIPMPGGPGRNRLRGRVLSTSFAGRYRRVGLSCPLILGPEKGGEIVLEVELPPSIRLGLGETIGLEISADRCLILPSGLGAGTNKADAAVTPLIDERSCL